MSDSSRQIDGRIKRIVLCGNGLAAQMALAALSRHLPTHIELLQIDAQLSDHTDIFYGTVTGPSAYAFNLAAGVTEPRLVLNSDSAFSWGTKYQRWGAAQSWMQCSHLALPILEGVTFHHYLARQQIDRLEPFLISAVAAELGAFAHPPEVGENDLSRAEFGYQFDPRSYAKLFAAAKDQSRIVTASSRLAQVERDESGIRTIKLPDGRSIDGDLFIDCTGPEASLLSALGTHTRGGRQLRGILSRSTADSLGPPYRAVEAQDFGWKSETPVQGGVVRLTVCDPESEADAIAAHGQPPEQTAQASLARRNEAWVGNCVAIGHAASVVEPLTPAPIKLLERDIERLLTLIPVSHDMSVERREFNRRFNEDYEHAGLFQRALFETDALPNGPYWRAARAEPAPEKLARKIEQFEGRGTLVGFDFEPFNAEDWLILHYGMGRKMRRHDPLADKANATQVKHYLAHLEREMLRQAKAMPSHDIYVKALVRHLKQRNG